MMDIIGALLAYYSQASCDHCGQKDTWYDDIRLHGMRDPVSCPGDCRLDECDGQTGMVDLCTDCHRELVRRR